MDKFESFIGTLGLMTLAFVLSFALVRLGRRWESHNSILVELLSRLFAFVGFILMVCSAPVWIVFYWFSNIVAEAQIEEKRKAWNNTEEALRKISYDAGFNDAYESGEKEIAKLKDKMSIEVSKAEFNAKRDGYTFGKKIGFDDGYDKGYALGFEDGRKEGFSEGRDYGYTEGLADSKDETE